MYIDCRDPEKQGDVGVLYDTVEQIAVSNCEYAASSNDAAIMSSSCRFLFFFLIAAIIQS